MLRQRGRLNESTRGQSLSAFLVLLILQFAPRVWALSPEAEARIDALARQTMADGISAGLVVAIGEQGNPTFERAYGLANLEWNAPVTTDTVFRVGSITKQFAAAGVLLLAEQKKLSLDDKLAKYFPDYPRGDEVTLRQLMNHTAGVHSYPGPTEKTIVRVGITVPDMVKHLAGLGYDFDPGTRWEYSNSGYFLIGAVIEQVTGQSLREFARERLFEPLRLTHTAVDTNDEIVPKRASAYFRDPARKGVFENADYIDMSVPHAAGGIRSTAGDLIKWTAALHGGRVVGAASYKEMTTPASVRDKEDAQYGLGLHLLEKQGHRLINHDGGIEGFQASMTYVVDSQTTVVVLANTQGGALALATAIVEIVLAPAKSQAAAAYDHANLVASVR
jgi:CubicO group peptidase (beta-lactamase class C family)